MHASAHAQNIRDMQKKAHLVWLKKRQGVKQIARLKQQRFLSPTLFKIQRSYVKNHAYLLFHWSSGENCIIFTFLYTKDNRLWQIKKKHEWWNNRFSDAFTLHLNLENSASLFFLIQGNFMFWIKSSLFFFQL